MYTVSKGNVELASGKMHLSNSHYTHPVVLLKVRCGLKSFAVLNYITTFLYKIVSLKHRKMVKL